MYNQKIFENTRKAELSKCFLIIGAVVYTLAIESENVGWNQINATIKPLIYKVMGSFKSSVKVQYVSTQNRQID